MTGDEERVEAYRAWIEAAWKQLRVEGQKWLEVGPGRDACLSLLLLKAHPEAHYLGVEVNRLGCLGARRALASYRNAQVIEGFVGEAQMKKLPEGMNALLHEIFGFIASSEGVVATILALRRKYPGALSVPEMASTYLVPLEIRAEDVVKDPSLLMSHCEFRTRLPFAATQLTSEHALLEVLDFRPEGKLEASQRQRRECRIERDGFLTVLGIYIVLKGWDWSLSSNASHEHAASSWCNLALVLPHPWPVKRGRILSVRCEAELSSAKPTYRIELSYERRQQRWDLDCDMLYGGYRYLHQLRDDKGLGV